VETFSPDFSTKPQQSGRRITHDFGVAKNMIGHSGKGWESGNSNPLVSCDYILNNFENVLQARFDEQGIVLSQLPINISKTK